MRWTLLVVLLAGCAESKRKPVPAGPPPGGMGPSPMMMGGIDLPEMRKASEARLEDDDEVVGIVVGGTARAYSLKAMAPMTSHVVNDLAGGVPVTVTYCDLAECVRVFTGPGKGKHLGLGQMGRVEDSLLLNAGGRMIRQSTGRAMGGEGEPLPTVAHERTTWKAWRTAHPDTLAYDRSPRSAIPGGEPGGENW
ncbi:MAG: DUF3179 domain-containing protein [Gemmataceae bacterium]|nr:DUF3179 domain-containing protein [Gemmataceae bacterium]